MQDQEMIQQLVLLLVHMFDDSRFREIARNLWQANIDGTKLGVAVAVRPRNRDNYLLNFVIFDRLMKALVAKAIDFAFVVVADKGKFKLIYVGSRQAEKVHEVLKNVPPLDGMFGKFWLLMRDLTPACLAVADDIDDEDEMYM